MYIISFLFYSPGSIRTQYRLYFDNQEITEQVCFPDHLF